jgi:hypothetical protein
MGRTPKVIFYKAFCLNTILWGCESIIISAEIGKKARDLPAQSNTLYIEHKHAPTSEGRENNQRKSERNVREH